MISASKRSEPVTEVLVIIARRAVGERVEEALVVSSVESSVRRGVGRGFEAVVRLVDDSQWAL